VSGEACLRRYAVHIVGSVHSEIYKAKTPAGKRKQGSRSWEGQLSLHPSRCTVHVQGRSRPQQM